MTEPVPVRVRGCECPGTPHGEEGDLVFLAPIPSLACGLAGQADRRAAGADGVKLAQLWLISFVRHGAVGWNFRDAKGPVPFDVEVILADYSLGILVADKAEELGYVDALMRPFRNEPLTHSPIGPIESSTSPGPTSTDSPHRRSWLAGMAGMGRSRG